MFTRVQANLCRGNRGQQLVDVVSLSASGYSPVSNSPVPMLWVSRSHDGIRTRLHPVGSLSLQIIVCSINRTRVGDPLSCHGSSRGVVGRSGTGLSFFNELQMSFTT
jgi:hypothetical protein